MVSFPILGRFGPRRDRDAPRRRLAELEARARARHEAELKRLQQEEEEEARRLEAERLRAEAARRAQLESEEEAAAEPEDPLQAERASLDEYDLGLYEVFNSLLPPNDKKRLLPFPRLMQWPVAANGAISASRRVETPSRHRRRF